MSFQNCRSRRCSFQFLPLVIEIAWVEPVTHYCTTAGHTFSAGGQSDGLRLVTSVDLCLVSSAHESCGSVCATRPNSLTQVFPRDWISKEHESLLLLIIYCVLWEQNFVLLAFCMCFRSLYITTLPSLDPCSSCICWWERTPSHQLRLKIAHDQKLSFGFRDVL